MSCELKVFPFFKPQNIIRLVDGRLDNGQIYCQVEREPVTTVNGIKFDLPKESYFLLLASGSAIRPSTVDYHDIVRIGKLISSILHCAVDYNFLNSF